MGIANFEDYKSEVPSGLIFQKNCTKKEEPALPVQAAA